MEELLKVAGEVANLASDTADKLAEILDSTDKMTKSTMSQSFCGLLIDSVCAKFGLDENATWDNLHAIHSEVNEEFGDFRA